MSTATPYRPGNGTEGAIFMDRFCCRCKRDEDFQSGTGDSCEIAALSIAFRIGDPEYPKEWIEDDQGPRCTAFEPSEET